MIAYYNAGAYLLNLSNGVGLLHALTLQKGDDHHGAAKQTQRAVNIDAFTMLLDKFNARGKGLEARLKKAGRRLPRRLQKAGRVIVGMQAAIEHPKLALVQNQDAVDAAFVDLTAHLTTIDRADRRRGFALGIAGDLVIRLVLLAIAVVVILRWQGVI